jgi:predicted  nucleic acid-binding Zn-ribbon protein
LQPIFTTVDAVAEFAEQFTHLESENTQLRRAIKTSADQLLEANKLATDAQKENTLLKEELKKLKQTMKDDQDAKRKAVAVADEKEGVLRESIANLMGEFSAHILFQYYPSSCLSIFLQALPI